MLCKSSDVIWQQAVAATSCWRILLGLKPLYMYSGSRKIHLKEARLLQMANKGRMDLLAGLLL